jgi:hypothetical protein
VSTLVALITFAANETEHSSDKTLFYVAGGLLAGWAVLVSAVGIKRHRDWPSSKGTANGLMAISGLLVAFALASAIITN